MAFIGKDSVTVTSLDSAESMSVVTDLTVDTNTFKVDSTANRVGILNATPDVTLDVGSATDAIHIPVGTTAQRPGTPSSGYFRFNTSLNQFEGYTDTWGAIGGGGTNTFTHDSFTGDSSTTDFILSQSTESENNLFVFVDGVFQTQDAYSIATAAGQTTLTLSAPPATGRKIIVYTVAAGVSGNNLNQNRFDALTSDVVDGLNTVFTLSIAPVNKNNTQVFFDGVYQHKENYSISGTTLTFTDAPPLGVVIEVMIFTQTEVNVPVDNSITSAKLSGDLTTPGNLTVTGYLAGPATFIIDPAAIGDDTGTVQIKGNLQVDGTQTTINSTTLEVDDLNITIASGAVDALSADGAGITVDGASATLTYVNFGDNWNFNKSLDVTGTVTADGLTVDGTGSVTQSSNAATALMTFTNANAGASARSAISFASDTGSSVVGTVSSGWTVDALSANETFLYGSNGVSLFAPASQDVRILAGGGEKLVVKSSGNVGIGTDSPEALLSLSKTTAGGEGGYIYIDNPATSTLDSKSGIKFGTSSGASFASVPTGEITNVVTDAGSGASALTFGTFNGTDSDERMRIDSSGNVTIDGSDASTSLASTAILNLKAGDADNEYSILRFATSADGSIASIGAKATTTGAYPSSVGNLEFGVQNGASTVTAMTIDSSGNVGIGVSPAKTLDVRTSSGSDAVIRVGSSSSIGINVNVGAIEFYSADADDAGVKASIANYVTGNEGPGGAVDGNLIFSTTDSDGGGNDSPTERMRIDSQGQVRLSNTTPVWDTTFNSLVTKGGWLGSQSTDYVYLGGQCYFNADWKRSNTGAATLYQQSFGAHTWYNTPSGAADSTISSWTQAMTLDASGNLLVGTTDTTPWDNSTATAADDGIFLGGGRLGLAKWGGVPLLVNRTDSDGEIAIFYKDGSAVGSIASTDGTDLQIGSGNCYLRFDDADNKILPTNAAGAKRDNVLDLGHTDARFGDIYASNGTIQTSDRNEKQDIETLSDAEQRVAVACKGLLRKWRWKDAVEAKGDEARIHFGIIAQDLQAAFEAEGLDAGRYAMFMSNTWTDEETGEERTRLGVRYHELLAFIIAAI